MKRYFDDLNILDNDEIPTDMDPKKRSTEFNFCKYKKFEKKNIKNPFWNTWNNICRFTKLAYSNSSIINSSNNINFNIFIYRPNLSYYFWAYCNSFFASIYNNKYFPYKYLIWFFGRYFNEKFQSYYFHHNNLLHNGIHHIKSC